MQEAGLVVLETGIGCFGRILIATLVAAFIVIFAFIAIYNASRARIGIVTWRSIQTYAVYSLEGATDNDAWQRSMGEKSSSIASLE